MKNIHLPALLAAVVLVLGSCRKEAGQAPGTTPVPTVAEVFHNVSYGTHPQQVYDLYLPADRSAARTKVIVLVHGGGWVGGDKSSMDTLVGHIQATHPHHAIANLNYVLGDSSTKAFPNQVTNIGQALGQIAAQSAQLQVLPQFALVGTSAGAHLAMLYDYAYDSGDRVKMVADIVGPSDLTDPFYVGNPLFQAAFIQLTDETAFPPGTNLNQALSPVFQVGPASSPTVMFYGTTDNLVPTANAYTLDSALSAHGIPHQLTIYQGGHGDWAEADIADVLQQVSQYVDLYLPVE